MIAYAEKGDSFYSACKKVQETLKNPEDYCDLIFNDIRVRVSKNSNIDDLQTIYHLQHTINRLKAGYNIL
jgi:hypothetical protein